MYSKKRRENIKTSYHDQRRKTSVKSKTTCRKQNLECMQPGSNPGPLEHQTRYIPLSHTGCGDLDEICIIISEMG